MEESAKKVQASVAQQANAGAWQVARKAAPLQLLSLALLRGLLGTSANTHAVKLALAMQFVAIALRWGLLMLLAPRKGRPIRHRAWHMYAVTGSAWLTSAGVAHILLAANGMSEVQVLEAIIVCTAACAIGQRSMVPHLLSFGGYVLIQFSALMLIVLESKDPAIIPVVPATICIFLAALAMSAVRGNAELRDRLRLTIELHESSVRDALTGLRNRRFASEFAEQRAAQAMSAREPGRRESMPPGELAFLIVDLDHFKSVNDRHGHAGGDRVLAAFAAIATKTFRAHDVIARWGGEEFLVILEVPHEGDARAAGERLRKAVAEASVEVTPGVKINVTCSMGGATLGRAATSWQDAVHLADEALYRAKASGRNRLCWDGDAAAEPTVTRTLKLNAYGV